MSGFDHEEIESVELSQDVINSIVSCAIPVAFKVIVKETAKLQKRSRSQHFRDVRKILEKYASLKRKVKEYNRKYTDEEVGDYIFRYLQGLMENREDKVEEQIVSEMRTMHRTFRDVRKMEEALKIYKYYCDRSVREEMHRQYDVLHHRYLGRKEMSVPEIAELMHISEETVRRDLKLATAEIAYFIDPDLNSFF